MKITDVKAVYPNYRHVVPSWRTHLWQIVVRIDTDVGVSGCGYGGGGVAAVEVVNTHFRELLLGRTVDSVEDIAREESIPGERIPGTFGRPRLRGKA
jgi:L-alanine-DL-glutamate epimerase-like enolase superfamily enzyme